MRRVVCWVGGGLRGAVLYLGGCDGIPRVGEFQRSGAKSSDLALSEACEYCQIFKVFLWSEAEQSS